MMIPMTLMAIVVIVMMTLTLIGRMMAMMGLVSGRLIVVRFFPGIRRAGVWWMGMLIHMGSLGL